MAFSKKRKYEKTVPVVKDEYPTFLERWLKTTSSTAKQLMWLLTINSVLWIWASYVLAGFGKDQIAESLSSNVCTVVLGGLIGYLTSSTIQNLSKYNPRLGGTPVHELEAMAEARVTEETNELADMIEEASSGVELSEIDNPSPDEEQSVEDPGVGIVETTNEEVVG